MKTFCIMLAVAVLALMGCDKSPEARREKLISQVERKIQQEIPAYLGHAPYACRVKVSEPYLCAYVDSPGDQLARYSRDFAQARDVLDAAKQAGLTTIVIHNGRRSNEVDTTAGTTQMVDVLPSGCK
jgi:uncharacterized lipoprotein NlpE involved in copper resistance